MSRSKKPPLEEQRTEAQSRARMSEIVRIPCRCRSVMMRRRSARPGGGAVRSLNGFDPGPVLPVTLNNREIGSGVARQSAMAETAQIRPSLPVLLATTARDQSTNSGVGAPF